MIWNVEKNKQTHERRNLFMKKVTKLFLSIAAISALAAGLATSAMAMTASYDATAGTVTITAEEGDLVASSEKTLLILNNDAVTVTEVVAISIPDTPGQLSRVLDILGNRNVNLEYLYTFLGKSDRSVSFVRRVDDIENASVALNDGGIIQLTENDIAEM